MLNVRSPTQRVQGIWAFCNRLAFILQRVGNCDWCVSVACEARYGGRRKRKPACRSLNVQGANMRPAAVIEALPIPAAC